MSETSVSQQNFLQKRDSISALFTVPVFSFSSCFWEFGNSLPQKDLLIPLFSAVLQKCSLFWSMVCDKSIFLHITVTLYETLVSFFSSFVQSSCDNSLWFSPKLSEILEPFLVVLNSLPKSALAPLLIVWHWCNSHY